MKNLSKSLFGIFFKSHSLRTQIMLSIAGLTIFTATAVGMTALQINYRYLEREKRTQSLLTMQDFYRSEENEIANMAILAASRPNLISYLANEEYEILDAYLDALKAGMVEIDAITLCDNNDRVLAATDPDERIDNCNIESNPQYTVMFKEDIPQAWMLRGRKVYNGGDAVGKVILGVQLDADFLLHICDRCDLYHTLKYNDFVIATTFGNTYINKTNVRFIPMQLADAQFQQSFNIGDQLYYVSDFDLNGSGLFVEVALNVTSIKNDQHQQEFYLTVVIIVVVLLALLVGMILAQCIQKPLGQLVTSTSRLRTDNLENPIRVETNVREVNELSETLEDARIGIKEALSSLQKEKQWTDLLLQSIVEGIIILNDEGTITYFSPGAERITGWKHKETVGYSANNIFKPADIAATFLSQMPPLGEKHRFSVMMKDNKKKILSITRAELPSSIAGDATKVLVIRDVSEEEALSHLLGNFLANITHEFRTPLSALAASIEILLNEADDLEPQEIKELLKSIHLGTFNLENLIENLLEGASIETGRFQVSPRPAGLRTVILSACEIIGPLLKKYGQELVLDLPEALPLVLIDPRRISQVLINLLSNASKYGPNDSAITLAAEIQEGMIEVTVSDHGPGIPAAFREELFSGFILTRIEDGSMKKGAGLGLSVINAIIKAHGGQVGVRDLEGSGAQFWFTIPVTGES